MCKNIILEVFFYDSISKNIGNGPSVAEILVYNNRLYYYPIFKDLQYSFQRLTVKSVMTDFINNPILLENTFIFEDLVIKGFII